MGKKNCWEFMACGREPGGANVANLGVCPAATELRLNGAHEGKNGGRVCWMVAGTLCEKQVQGLFASKRTSCRDCPFYLQVRKEERSTFILKAPLLSRLH